MAGLLGRKTSGDANVQGSTAWLLRLKNTLENSQKDMSLVPTSNVVALDPEVLKNDVRRLERRLKNMQLFLLDPKSKKMQVSVLLNSAVRPDRIVADHRVVLLTAALGFCYPLCHGVHCDGLAL